MKQTKSPQIILKQVAKLLLTIQLFLYTSGCGSPSHLQKTCHRRPSCEKRLLLKTMHTPSSLLGPTLQLADYGRTNPQCWTHKNAPSKVRQRLQRVEAATGARSKVGGRGKVLLCYLELVRKGTHDDILFKVYLFDTVTHVKKAWPSPYLVRKRAQLRSVGFPPMVRAGRGIFYVVGSTTNLKQIHRLFPYWKKKWSHLMSP